MSFLVSWIVLAAIVLLTAAIVPGMRVRGVVGAIWVAALFGIVNALIGWVLFVMIGVGTLGIGFLLAFLTRWIVNAVVLKIVDRLTTSLEIVSFGTAFLAAVVMSALGTLAEALLLQTI